MIWRLQLWRMVGAMAVLAVLSLAPQAASAHGGHSHSQHGNMTAGMDQLAAPAARVAIPAIEELTEAADVAPLTTNVCDGRGCCFNGPCTGCHSFLGIAVPATTPPVISSILRPDDPLPHVGAGGTRLRRPPKSFV